VTYLVVRIEKLLVWVPFEKLVISMLLIFIVSFFYVNVVLVKLLN
jgi:hypothetical protein